MDKLDNSYSWLGVALQATAFPGSCYCSKSTTISCNCSISAKLLKCFQNLFEWALGAASARSSIQVNKKAQQELNAFLLRFILKSIS